METRCSCASSSRPPDGGDGSALPETVETLITTRIDTLEPGDRFLLRNASVLGARFELDLLADVLADELEDVGDLDRWRRLGEFVAWEGTNMLSFRHDLFRTVAYEGLSFRRRREIHGRVGSMLGSAAPGRAPGARTAALAPLPAGGGLRARLALLGRRSESWPSADRRTSSRPSCSSAHRGRPPEPPADEIARVAEMLGDVCELAGRYEEAGAAYLRARESDGDGLPQTRLMRKEGILRERLGNYPEALDWYERGLDALDNAGDESRVQLELATAGVKYRQGRFDEGIEWGTRAAEHAELAATGRARARLHPHPPQPRGARQEGRRARPPGPASARGSRRLVLQSSLVNNLGSRPTTRAAGTRPPSSTGAAAS